MSEIFRANILLYVNCTVLKVCNINYVKIKNSKKGKLENLRTLESQKMVISLAKTVS